MVLAMIVIGTPGLPVLDVRSRERAAGGKLRGGDVAVGNEPLLPREVHGMLGQHPHLAGLLVRDVAVQIHDAGCLVLLRAVGAQSIPLALAMADEPAADERVGRAIRQRLIC
jgi:hypothetical protein